LAEAEKRRMRGKSHASQKRLKTTILDEPPAACRSRAKKSRRGSDLDAVVRSGSARVRALSGDLSFQKPRIDR
jgi:hypothetical protein